MLKTSSAGNSEVGANAGVDGNLLGGWTTSSFFANTSTSASQLATVLATLVLATLVLATVTLGLLLLDEGELPTPLPP